MKQLKKRALTLVLASVVTVAAFFVPEICENKLSMSNFKAFISRNFQNFKTKCAERCGTTLALRLTIRDFSQVNANSCETTGTVDGEDEENISSENEASDTTDKYNIAKNEHINPKYFQEEQPYEEPSNDKFLFIMSILLVVVVGIFSYMKAKEKMTQITGEQINLDLDDDDDKPKGDKKKADKKDTAKLRATIKDLDAKYEKSKALAKNNEYISPIKAAMAQSQSSTPTTPIEETNVVDLDELFQEQVKAKDSSETEEENAALEDFLSGFSFDEEFVGEQVKEENPGYDVEFYEKVLNNGNLKFSSKDIECINSILDMEINDATLHNIDKYLISNPIKKEPTKQEILEDLVTSYSISQNVSFSKDDINSLAKLISVEIDNDFVTDLRTNPERTKEMYEDMKKNSDKSQKPTEILTLNVKDMLPDLSEALKNQPAKNAEPERKSDAVYASEGYEVSKLKISDKLPDLTKELEKKDAFTSKPTTRYDVVDNSYTVSKLKISDELPDLSDALAHPEKYATPEPEEVVADEGALLNNIMNVQFKPFDDGTRQFEVLNDFEAPATTYDDYGYGQYEEQEPVEVEMSEEMSAFWGVDTKYVANELEQNLNFSESSVKQVEQPSISMDDYDTCCSPEGISFKIISSVNFTDNTGCHLVKNQSGYAIMAFVGDRLSQIKTLGEISSEKIMARLSEKLDNGKDRYLVRVDNTKFLVNSDSNSVEYIMDL